MSRRRVRRKRGGLWWTDLSREELLELRICELGLRIEGTALADRMRQLDSELERADLCFRPYAWLSTDWFTPDECTGFAIPFFLAHPRLARLERQHMFEVEGGTRDWCMKLLRHETGHAISNAYRLHRRKRWKKLFGQFSAPYRSTYVPKPYSKSYVINLDNNYGQSHPAEDFAETFAAWMRPGFRWWKHYEGWPAMRKLEYVDELMIEIGEQRPPLRTRIQPESLSRCRSRLSEYWEEKQERYEEEPHVEHDRALRRLFSDDPAFSRRRRAADFLRSNRAPLRRRVAVMTGQYRYVVEQVLDDVILRCSELDLRLTRAEAETRVDAAVLLTVRVMNSLHGGFHMYSR